MRSNQIKIIFDDFKRTSKVVVVREVEGHIVDGVYVDEEEIEITVTDVTVGFDEKSGMPIATVKFWKPIVEGLDRVEDPS